jgi:hypothetical protein
MNTPVKQTCTTAMLSLVFGVISWFALPVVGALIAIICGHMARAEIRRSQGQLDGDGLAVGGLVLGYLHLALFAMIIVCVLLFFGGLAAFLAFFGHHGHF